MIVNPPPNWFHVWKSTGAIAAMLFVFAGIPGRGAEPATYRPDPGPYRVLTVDQVLLHDTTRSKDLPLKIYYPQGPGPFRKPGREGKLFQCAKVETLAFWDGYLKNDASAKQYLVSDGLVKFCDGAAQVDRK